MKNKPSRGLGKGLGALLNDSYSSAALGRISAADSQGQAGAGQGASRAVQGEGASGAPTMLAITQLQPSRYQPRTRFSDESLKELSDSIAKNGIMQPILVRQMQDGSGNYEIVAGERRFRAAKLARLDMVPVVVRELTDREALELAIVENVQRQDLNPVEEAAGYQRLMDEFGYTQETVAQTIGKSRSHVSNSLRLLTLPESVREYVANGKLSFAHARALLNAGNPAALAEEVVKRGLNVRQTESLASGQAMIGGEGGERPRASSRRTGRARAGAAKDADVLALEEMLSGKLGVAVSIVDRGQSGDIVLTYETLTELDTILKRLGGGM